MTIMEFGKSKFDPNWDKHPFLLMSIFFILGIHLSNLVDVSLEVLILSSIFYIGFLIWFEKIRWISVNLLFYKTMVVCMGVLLAGMTRNEIEKPYNSPNHILNYINFDQKEIQVEGIVTQIDQGANSWKVFVDVNKICQSRCLKTKTKTIVYVKGFLIANELDKVKIRGTLLPKRSPNFKAFDYDKYLERKGIFFTIFAKAENDGVEVIDKSPAWSNPIIRVKNVLIKRIDKYIPDDLIGSLCKAMFLGDRSDVNDDTIKLFSHTGVIHILAVSGMHVAIVMGFIIWLTGLIKSDQLIWVSVKKLIVIGFTIVFIMITGATPSVQRAGLIFIILYLTKGKENKLNSLNVLGMVAMIILLYDPVQVLTLSFQFSFTAVLSILLFHSWIDGWVKSENIWLKKIWNFFAVSLSVQILMAPLIIYYFGFYTTWFFINNIAAIPMVYAGIFGSVLVASSSFISKDAAIFLGDVVTQIMGGFYDLLAFMNKIPLALIDQISWTIADLALVYFIIFSMTVFLIFKQTFHLKSLIYSLCLLILSLTFTAFKNASSSEVVFYSVSKGYIIDIFDGNRLYSLKNNKLDKTSEEYSTSAYRRSKQCTQPIYLSMEANSENRNLLTGKNVFQYKSSTFLRLLPKESRNLETVNYVIIDKNIIPSDISILENYEGEVILLNEAGNATIDAITNLPNRNFKIVDISKIGSYLIQIK